MRKAARRGERKPVATPPRANLRAITARGSSSHATRLAVTKLAESGLDLADARALGIDVLDAATIPQLHHAVMPVLKFNYYAVDGTRRDDLYRIRTLGPPPVGAFGEVTPKTRYFQPAGSPVGVYYPQNCLRPWAEVLADPDTPLVITEGELKAASACKAGVTTLALGGVWSWCKRSSGVGLLTELKSVAWGRRQVTLAFDSDAQQNPSIAQALASIVVELRDRGAVISSVQFPQLASGDKCGLDDYLVARGVDALKELLNEATIVDDLIIELLTFNTRYVYLRNPGKLIFDTHENRLLSSEVFLEVEGNVKALKLTPTPKGKRSALVRVAKEWVEWPARRSFDSVTYEPGQPQLLNGVPGRHLVNKWAGWGVEPAAGDVTPWVQLLDHLFTGAEPAARAWFERWCAYPLQHPGTKLVSACGFWSREQGQGKSLIGVTLGKIYGLHNYVAIDERELEGTFNHWAEAKQFVMVDDMTSSESRENADRLKKLITQREININLKFTPQYTLPDHLNFYMTSNRCDAFYIDQEDRRFFVHEVTVPRREQGFYDSYHAWLAGAGPAALFAYLLALDLGDFSPYLPPPLTAAKQAMIEAARTDLETWVAELREAPEGKLRLGAVTLTRDLFTTRELMAFYLPEQHGRTPGLKTLTNVLGARFKKVNKGKQVKVDGVLERYWAVRNAARWLTASPAAVAEHVAACRALEVGRGKY